MEKEVFLWLGLMILFLVVELATVGLTSIWLAGGALIALFVALAGATVAWQCIAFIVVSVLLLIFTRPFATRYINRHHEKTNCDELIGRTVRVTEQVDNYEQRAGMDCQIRKRRSEDQSRQSCNGDGNLRCKINLKTG